MPTRYGPLREGSARRRDLYLTTHDTHNKHPRPTVRFEPAIPESERRQTDAFDGAATGIRLKQMNVIKLHLATIKNQKLIFALLLFVMLQDDFPV